MSPKSEPYIETRRRHSSTSWRVQNENAPPSKPEVGSTRVRTRRARGPEADRTRARARTIGCPKAQSRAQDHSSLHSQGAESV
ncbi:hypothetical protein K438DRAFT_1840611 [Mycena galopus ATCC 62051]|nr:hypothetical protein K438DRAFT_1840611 [Mycena galopus ATCC 62051]